jgi:hypothetical protein
LQDQIDRLSEKDQSQDLTPEERLLWQQYEYLEHTIRMAKTQAYVKLNVQIESVKARSTHSGVSAMEDHL